MYRVVRNMLGNFKQNNMRYKVLLYYIVVMIRFNDLYINIKYLFIKEGFLKYLKQNKISCYNNCPNLAEMYKLFCTFVGCFVTASQYRPSIGLRASLAVGIFSRVLCGIASYLTEVLCTIKKLFQHKGQMNIC